jgi:putative chitinase
MAQQRFRVNNLNGMWLRSAPEVSEATQKVLLPNGQLVEKLAETEKPAWWHIRTTVDNAVVEGFSNNTLMVPEGEPGNMSTLLEKTVTAIKKISPGARSVYLDAIREGGPLFEAHGITTPLRMSHFIAQAMQETGGFTVLRESMNYSVQRMLEIFGVGQHSAKIKASEAPSFAHKEEALAERVYGLGNPTKSHELGNTQPGDGFRYRGNGFFQTTGRGAHRRFGLAFGLDFENNPELVTVREHILKPALKEWSDNNLNPLADQGKIVTITQKINGGTNGLEERKDFLAKLRHHLS